MNWSRTAGLCFERWYSPSLWGEATPSADDTREAGGGRGVPNELREREKGALIFLPQSRVGYLSFLYVCDSYQTHALKVVQMYKVNAMAGIN